MEQIADYDGPEAEDQKSKGWNKLFVYVSNCGHSLHVWFTYGVIFKMLRCYPRVNNMIVRNAVISIVKRV